MKTPKFVIDYEDAHLNEDGSMDFDNRAEAQYYFDDLIRDGISCIKMYEDDYLIYTYDSKIDRIVRYVGEKVVQS